MKYFLLMLLLVSAGAKADGLVPLLLKDLGTQVAPAVRAVTKEELEFAVEYINCLGGCQTKFTSSRWAKGFAGKIESTLIKYLPLLNHAEVGKYKIVIQNRGKQDFSKFFADAIGVLDRSKLRVTAGSNMDRYEVSEFVVEGRIADVLTLARSIELGETSLRDARIVGISRGESKTDYGFVFNVGNGEPQLGLLYDQAVRTGTSKGSNTTGTLQAGVHR